MREIPLTQGVVALVDDEDFERVNQFKWTASFQEDRWYAVRSVKRDGVWRHVRMHAFILGVPHSRSVDHRDGDGLNNQKGNLRRCTQHQNLANSKLSSRNTSGFKGVSWNRRESVWVARVVCYYRQMVIGRFSDRVAAARAYDAAAIRYFGDFAKTNVSLGLLPPLPNPTDAQILSGSEST